MEMGRQISENLETTMEVGRKFRNILSQLWKWVDIFEPTIEMGHIFLQFAYY